MSILSVSQSNYAKIRGSKGKIEVSLRENFVKEKKTSQTENDSSLATTQGNSNLP